MKKHDQIDDVPMNPWLAACREFIKAKIDGLNSVFNNQPLRIRKSLLIVFGISIASMCASLITSAITGDSLMDLSIEKISRPRDMNTKESDTLDLTPVGKLKGEIDGEFEAFYLAVDSHGQLFINRNPELSAEAYNKSKGWEPISRHSLKQYEERLHFIPNKRKGLKK